MSPLPPIVPFPQAMLTTNPNHSIHGSDSQESARKEIDLWFKPEELASYKSAQFDWVYEKA